MWRRACNPILSSSTVDDDDVEDVEEEEEEEEEEMRGEGRVGEVVGDVMGESGDDGVGSEGGETGGMNSGEGAKPETEEDKGELEVEEVRFEEERSVDDDAGEVGSGVPPEAPKDEKE